MNTYPCGCAFCGDLNGPPCAAVRNLELRVMDLERGHVRILGVLKEIQTQAGDS